MNALELFSHWRIIHLRWGKGIPQRWIVWHVLEHEVHHRGEIYLMLGLANINAADSRMRSLLIRS